MSGTHSILFGSAMKKILFTLACTLVATHASAALVTFEFAGVINLFTETSLDTGREKPVLSTTVTPAVLRVGDTFRGRFSYDTAASQSAPDGQFDLSLIAVPSASLRFDGSNIEIISLPGMPPIWSAQHGSRFFALEPRFAPDASSTFRLAMFGPSQSTDYGVVPLPGTLSPVGFPEAFLNASWSNPALGKEVRLVGTLTAFGPLAPVPEPAGYAMLLAGAAVVGAAARRRMRSGAGR